MRHKISLPPTLPLIYVDLLLRTFNSMNLTAYLESIPGSVAIVIDDSPSRITNAYIPPLPLYEHER